MIMKRNLVVATIMMMTTTIIYAQQKEAADPHHRRGERMSQVLSLNDEQTETIKGIHKKYADRFTTIRIDSTLSHEDKRSAGKSLKEEKEAEIRSVLTPEQNEKWKTYKTERAEERKEQREKFAKEHASRMKTELSLSDDQAEKLKSINEDFKAKAQALRHEGKGDRESYMKLRDEYEGIVKSVLSDEQFKKWKEHNSRMRKSRKGKR